VVRVLCRVSLEPEVCVRRTENAFGRYGARFLVVAKFVPGLGLMAAPIAGQTKMRYSLFLAFDFIGTLLWACTYAALGLFLGERIERNTQLLGSAARSGVAAVLVAVVGLVAIRLVRRHRFRQRAATRRIAPRELKDRLDLGEPVYIVDLRHPLLIGPERDSLPGAVHFTPDEVIARKHLIPKDRQVVLFCDCPGEASAAQVARALQNGGLQNALPLEGGFDGWKLAGYPVAPLSESKPE
jgi:rhodanese-related sulfurtransferase